MRCISLAGPLLTTQPSANKQVLTQLQGGLMKKPLQRTTLAAASLFVVGAQAGPFILAGTDADEHGSATGIANVDG